jgi:hypothetical protein
MTLHRSTKFVMLVAFLGLLFGCSGKAGTETAATLKNSLDADIPRGTSIDEAELRLKARGFAVSNERDSAWADKEHLDYLYGDMREGGAVQRRWQVAVFYQQNAVTRIDVSAGLVGP